MVYLKVGNRYCGMMPSISLCCQHCISSSRNTCFLCSSFLRAVLWKSKRKSCCRQHSRRTASFWRRWACCQSPIEPAKPRFRIKEEDNSGKQEPQQDEIESINDQLKREILETRKRLGIEAKPVQVRKEVLEDENVEHMSVWNTLVASSIASLLAVFLDMFAWKVYSYVGTHPTSQTDMYIVQRLSGAIRLVLVGFSTLAAGLVSLVALGLILLLLQTSIRRLLELFSP
jgi:hypothetical protein